MLKIKFVGLLAAMVIGLVGGTVAQGADIQSKEFKVVGTWGNLSSWKNYEKPFWDQALPEISGGKLSGQAIPITEAGLKGTEVMRLLKLGVFDIAHGLVGYVAKENAAIEGADLSSIAQDFATMRKITNAYRDTLDKTFRKTYGATILSLHPWPASMIYCRDAVNGIADLKGKKIRVHSATLGDFVEGAGGVAVTLPFAEVVPALEKGVADCAITDPMSAFRAKWHEVTNHAFVLRVGYSITFSAISLKAWNNLNEETQNVLQSAFAKMEEKGWAGAERDDSMGVTCLTGTGTCTVGEAGKLGKVVPSQDDLEARETILQNSVLKRWAERCGSDCVKTWNATAGAAANLEAPAS